MKKLVYITIEKVKQANNLVYLIGTFTVLINVALNLHKLNITQVNKSA